MRMIDADELKNQIRHMPRTINPDLVQYSLVKAIIENMPTLTPPNEWVSVDEKLPEPGERVLATDCGFVGEFYINERGQWQRYNVNCHALLMALDILYWMPLPAPPGKDNNVPTNEPLTIEELREMDGEPVYVHNLFPAKRKFEWQWALVCKERGNAEATTYTYRFLDYGKTWIAYRRPPEGEENA